VGGGAEPRGARLGVAGKTAVLSCTAGPLSDPKEGDLRWRGVRSGVAVNFDRPEGSTLLPPSPPQWGGRVKWLQGGRQEPTPWERGRGLLTTGVSSKLTGVSSELTGVSSELTGVSSEQAGVSSKLTGVSSELTGVSSELTGVSSELMGVSSELTGVSSELTGVSSELTGVSSELTGVSLKSNFQPRHHHQIVSCPSLVTFMFPTFFFKFNDRDRYH
jgi:hypothetical protein